MYNFERSIKTLEMDKIRRMLSEKANCDDSKQMAIELMPSKDVFAVKALMQKTSDAYSLTAKYGAPSVYRFKNCDEQIKRAQKGSNLSLRELLDIAAVLKNIRGFADWRKRCENTHCALDDLFGLLRPNKSLEELITSCIISEDELADTASDELYQIRRKITSSQQKIRERLDQMIKSPSTQKYLQEPIITMRNDRFVVPVKIECRGEIKGLVHDTSSSGATVFVEPLAVVEANNEIRILKAKEEQEIERIIYALSAKVGEYADEIMSSYQCVAELDLYFAKAALAASMKASVPNISDNGCIELKKARHPLIDKDKVIPTDISLGKDFDVLVITGPNTGGKTVSIKTIGLLTLMACCGLMIPVQDGSTISVFDKVLVDIGDEQSIEQSLSTFSSHMTNIISILKAADNKSLVLIDELGAGTDPVEGAALAVAIIEKLAQQGAKIGATTHYAEMKMYALTTERVMNASCEFDVESLRPTYKLLMGIPGKSNAFAISRRLGMQDDIIERAKDHISTDNARFEDVVSQLEEARQNLELEKNKASSLKERERKARMEFNTYKQRMENQINKELEAAQNQARTIVERTRAQAEKLLQELDEMRRQKEAENFSKLVQGAKSGVKSGMKELDKTANPIIAQREDEEYVLPRPLQKGDTVHIVDLNEDGVVIAAPDNNGNVMVQAGIIKTKVPVSKLRLKDKPKPKNKPQGNVTKKVRGKAEREVRSEVDLRGCTVEEGIMILDQYIDNCVLSGVTTITIIHGKGTGVLRTAIQQHLRSHPNIRTFRVGVFGEGENGVTIAEIK